MHWTSSNAVRYVALSWLGGVLLQLAPMIQSHKIDWWTLVSQSIAALAAILLRVSRPDVVAPVDILNKSNVLPPSK